MIYKLGVPQFGRFFTVPCGAVDNYLKLADGDFYKVLLAALCTDSGIVDTESLAARCGITPAVAEEALLFWSGNGVISAEAENGASVSAAAAVPAASAVTAASAVDTASAPQTASDADGQLPVCTAESIRPTKSAVQRSHVRYSPKELAQKAREDKELQVLFDEVQKVFGRTINATDTAALVDIYEYYGFDVPSILILAQYCTDLGKRRMAYMQTVARDWYDRGICTYAQIEREIVRLTKQNDINSRLCSVLGIEPPLTKTQTEYFVRWTEWGFGIDMISIAGERCRDNKNKTDLRYINGILKRWHADGIMSAAAIEESDSKYRKSKESAALLKAASGERSYDLDKWRQMAESIDLDTLSFEEGE